MGVPVISLSGNSYVSRMSTAVLQGANLSNLCALSTRGYLDLACFYASQLAWLRKNREYWRQSIISNPLGNAPDLMIHLEQAFTQMANNLI